MNYNNNYSLVFFLENWASYHCREVFTDVNAIYFTSLRWDNECLKQFRNFKNSTFEKCILILFLV